MYLLAGLSFGLLLSILTTATTAVTASALDREASSFDRAAPRPSDHRSSAPGRSAQQQSQQDAASDPAEGLAFLPALSELDAASGCSATITVQHLGAGPAKIALLTWGEPGDCAPGCTGPTAIRCSGLLQPGQSWTFDGPSLEGSRSAAAFSLSGLSLDALGLEPGNPELAADRICELLEAQAVDDCRGYAGFRSAFAGDAEDWSGLNFKGIRGGSIAAEVLRDCGTSRLDSGRASASYVGLGGAALGTRDPVMGSYAYAAPLLFGERQGISSHINLQNAGDRCTSIELWFKAQDDCLRARICEFATLAPGESLRVTVADCVEPGFQGSAWIRGSVALAISIDHRTLGSGQAGLMSSGALAGHVAGEPDPQTGQAPSAGSRVLFAPLSYSEYQGWDTGIQVMNLSPDIAAKAKIYFLDRSGSIVTTLVDWICPRGSQTFFLPVVAELPGNWVGSVRVESQYIGPPNLDNPEAPPSLVASTFMRKFADRDRGRMLEAAAYNLLDETQGFVWPDGSPGGGLESGAGLLALPAMDRQPEHLGTRSELAVTNLVRSRGFTDYALILQDANGPVDRLCLRLHEQQVAYFDLARFAHLDPNFAGSGLISAVYWEHPLLDENAGFVRNLVGLGAVLVRRSDARLGEDRAGDETSVSQAFALRAAAARELAAVLPRPDCRPAPSDPPRSIAEAPSDAPRAYIPSLGLADGSDGLSVCAAWIDLQILGEQPSQLILVAFGAPGDCGEACGGSIRVECSPLLAPGGAFHLGPGSLPALARSAVAFSVDGVLRPEDLGLELGGVATVAEALCATLRSDLAGSCAAYPEFLAAWTAGAEHAGIPLRRVWGSGLAGRVTRRCPQGSNISTVDAAYEAPGPADLGLADPEDARFAYALPILDSVDAPGIGLITVQNAGSQCVEVTLELGGGPDCAAPRACAQLSLAPGEARSLDLSICGSNGPLASGWIRGSGPLAVVVDGRNLGFTSYSARPALREDPSGQPLANGSTTAYAALTFSEYQGWHQRIQVMNLGRQWPAKLKVSFLDRSGDIIDTGLAWICAGGASSIELPRVTDLSGNWIGSARVESLGYTGSDGLSVPAQPVQAVADLRRPAAGLGTGGEMAARYALVDEREAMLWPAGAGAGGLESGVGMLAIPALRRADPEAFGIERASSNLVLANLAQAPGYTDLALLRFDANGLIDHSCLRIYAGQAEYLDLGFGSIAPPGSMTSALVSATYWEQPHWRDGRIEGQALGLAGVLSEVQPPLANQPLQGDALSAARALPVTGAARAALADRLSGLSLCPGGRPSTPATATPLPTATSTAPATVTDLPPEPTSRATATSGTTMPPEPSRTPTPSANATAPTLDPSASAIHICSLLAGRVPQAAIDAALRDPQALAGWGQACNPSLPVSVWNPLRRSLSLRNPSAAYHPSFNGLLLRCGCP